MEKTDLNKQSLLVLIVFFCHIQKGTGFTSSPTASINCASSVANINFSLHLDPGETIVGKRIWFFGATKVAESNGTTLTSFGSYLSRVNAYGTYGISLSNVTLADAGSYTYTITLSPSGNPAIAAATLTVQVPPLAPPSGCSLSVSQSGNTVTCTVNTGSGNCGTPALIPNWVNSTPPSNQFECTVGETHQCCATSDALACYSRTSNDFCTLYTCIPTTPPPPANYSIPDNTTCEIELGCGIGLGSGIPCVITIIFAVIYINQGDTYAYQLGLLLGLGFGITFDIGWIIIVILISTGNKCKLELGLGIGLSSGMPCVIACIVAVIFMLVEFKGIPRRVNIGKGILTGLLIASVIGIIVVYLFYGKLKTDPTTEEPEEKPTEPNNKEPEEMPLGSTDKKNKTQHTGPPAIHIRTQNRVESEPTNKKTSDRPQPSPPVAVVTEDIPKLRPQPPPPENSDVKDPSKRGISANFDDKQGLPTEPPRSSRLPPLTQKQPTVEEEDASKEKPKKKRKNKKKKDQMKEETQAEEMEELKNKTTEDQFDGD